MIFGETIQVPPITIVGLGPGDRSRRTVVVQESLDVADCILARTLRHPGLDDLATDARAQDVSALVSTLPGDTMDWAAGARMACDLAAQGKYVVVAVPGHPFYGERLVLETIAQAEKRGIATTVHDGLSTFDLISTALRIDAMVDEVQVVDAAAEVHRIGSDMFGGGLFPFTPHRPMIISRVYTTQVVLGVQLLLKRIFPRDHPITVIDGAGMSGIETIRIVALEELGVVDGGSLVSLHVPAIDTLAGTRDPRAMQHISARLRQPDGCQWDRVQTHQSLRETFIAEVYEVLDAIDSDDPVNLMEELGDLFLLVTLNAQVAEENGTFTLEDVYESAASKIVRRHPHVFAGEHAESPEDLARIWKRVKAEERADALVPKPEKDFDDEPRSKPAITRAAKILKAHPLPTGATSPGRTSDERAADLMKAVAAIVDAGDDPDRILLDELREHHRHATHQP